jgi:DNA-binding response OmpR family regulator
MEWIGAAPLRHPSSRVKISAMNPDAPAPLIALVEDEDHLAQGLLFNLAAEGFRTHHESDGDAALTYLLEAPQSGPGNVAVIVLDCMLPGKDGFAITRALREAQRYTPILMLTARSRPEDVLEGLEAGADDYLPKPFDLNILIVRIKSLLRRTTWHASQAAIPAETAAEPVPADTYHFNHRTIRFDALELIAPNRITQLTVMEADLLRYLSDREGKIIPRSEILEQVWHVHADTDTRAIDNFIVRLRRYIEDDPANPQHLTTVRGIGYRFLANP